MISHDRTFMDGVIEKVYEIDEGTFIPYKGNYSDFLRLKDERYEQMMQTFRNQKKEIERVQEFINKFRSVASKASQVQSRVKQLEKLERVPKPRKPRKLFNFHFPQPPRSTQRVLFLEGIAKSFGEKHLYSNLDVLVERGDRIVLVGPNGSGKSTLLKMMAGLEPPDTGKVTKGTTTKMGYFSQHRSATLNEKQHRSGRSGGRREWHG